MQRIEIHLKNDERTKLEAMCSSGVNQVRSLQRAQILLALDKGISDQQIADVVNIDRISIWRIRKRYLKKGLEAAVYDQARSGRPVEYGDTEAEIVALACSNPPAGQRRWTLPLLTQVARRQSQMLTDVSQETVRQVLKKNDVSLG